jgi:hypothetical protein
MQMSQALPVDVARQIAFMARDTPVSVAIYGADVIVDGARVEHATGLYGVVHRSSSGIIETKVEGGHPLHVRSEKALRSFLYGIYCPALLTHVFVVVVFVGNNPAPTALRDEGTVGTYVDIRKKFGKTLVRVEFIEQDDPCEDVKESMGTIAGWIWDILN